ncbi:class I SAM-dependent methyltransferase [Variovorax sp. KK3]|uniref:class I SAM-dependent methyltransferase n=1 Tax=Variovorax sp. KK3 TaxID=1855728 RepID=UPI00097C9854|nr:class I SAM-dependent methyltransferase [Variovorax sp. KK3]
MLDFTGERFIPTESGEIRYEHMHRYCWAQSLCAGRDVLDIACGEGYGSALLAQVARSVVGVDISQEAVDHAARNYERLTHLRFAQGSATAIPVEDSSIDVVVSFETLEHLDEQEEMLAEIRRVLKPDGLLVISSPNKKVYSDDRNYVNEFHVKELYFDELDALLGRHFGATRYFGQRFLTASALLPLERASTRYEALLLGDAGASAETLLSHENMYFVAVCAASAHLLPVISPNLFVEPGTDLYTEQQGVMRWASGLDAEHRQLQQQHLALQAEFDQRTAWALELDARRQQLEAESLEERQRLHSELGEAKRTLQSTQQKLQQAEAVAAQARAGMAEANAGMAEARQALATMTNSRSWRLLAPVRWLARRLA